MAPQLSDGPPLDESDLLRLTAGTHPDPFTVLGPTGDGAGLVVHLPGARQVWVVNDTDTVELEPHPGAAGVFTGPALPYYRLRISWSTGVAPERTEEREDPYRFTPVIGDMDEYLIGEGTRTACGRCSAPICSPMKVWPGCISRCGHRMRHGCRSSATTTPGIRWSTRCAHAAPPECGSSSFPG